MIKRLLLLPFLFSAVSLQSAPIQFDEALITQVVNEVEIIDQATLRKSDARLNEKFEAPDILQTGRRSRAQMTAEDGTIFRVGSNSVFSFDPATRDMNLKKGSLLFNTPSGQGGGRVVTASASASVLGTTIIVVATSDGGFKVLCVEGAAQVAYNDGRIVDLSPGQLTFVMAGGTSGPVLNFDLQRQTKGSRLINGFEQSLPSIQSIDSAVEQQNQEIEEGEYSQTGQLLIDVQDQGETLRTVDASVVDIATNPEDNGAGMAEPPSSPANSVEIALRTDATINNDNLFPPANLFPEDVIITPAEDEFLGVDVFGEGVPYRGIIAQNIQFDATRVTFTDFPSPTENSSDFIDYAASDSIHFTQATHEFLAGPNLSSNLYFSAPTITFLDGGGEVSTDFSFIGTPSGTPVDVFFATQNTLEANSVNFNFDQMDNLFSLRSTEGDVLFVSSTVDTVGGNIGLGSDTGSIDLRQSEFYANSISLFGKEVFVTGTNLAGSQVSVQGIETRQIDLIEISGGSIAADRFDAAAQTRLAMNNVTLTDLTNVSLGARTLVLENINFPANSMVNLSSANGQLAPNPNTGSPALPGFVNFIREVSYGGLPAQNFINNGITLSTFP